MIIYCWKFTYSNSYVLHTLVVWAQWLLLLLAKFNAMYIILPSFKCYIVRYFGYIYCFQMSRSEMKWTYIFHFVWTCIPSAICTSYGLLFAKSYMNLHGNNLFSLNLNRIHEHQAHISIVCKVFFYVLKLIEL